jgi:toxin ParE1/3/4
MTEYRLSNEAKGDLIRIHHYGVEKFGITQADKYFDAFFEYSDIIAQQPFSFESVDYINVLSFAATKRKNQRKVTTG